MYRDMRYCVTYARKTLHHKHLRRNTYGEERVIHVIGDQLCLIQQPQKIVLAQKLNMVALADQLLGLDNLGALRVAAQQRWVLDATDDIMRLMSHAGANCPACASDSKLGRPP